jgi:hypothetical protein
VISGGGGSGPYGGAVTLDYLWDTGTTDADPGSAKIRGNNATTASITSLYCNLTDNNAQDETAVLDTFDSSTSTTKAHLRLTKKTDVTKWMIFALTARTTASGYRKFTVSQVSQSGASPFANGDEILINFTRVGDLGATGASAGGVSVPNMIQSKYGTGNSQNPTLFTFGSAPVSGHSILLVLNMVGRDATAISSTNTTWTKVDSYTSGGGSHYQVWVGVVSGTGGTAVSMTSGSSNFWSAIAMEITDALTPTEGAVSKQAYDGAFPGTSAPLVTTSGRLVVFALGIDNTTSMPFFLPNIPFVQADITSHGSGLGTTLCAGYAPTGVVQATYMIAPGSLGALIMVEVT